VDDERLMQHGIGAFDQCVLRLISALIQF